MDKETYEKQRAFAGEKKPSMKRRCVGHDYTERQMYMVTMTVEGRRPLLGTLVGNNETDAQVELTELGRAVEEEWWACTQHHPEIEVIALQIMPDHIHGILFVREKMEKPLGMALRGFKQSCNKHFRSIILKKESPPVPAKSPSVALPTQPTTPQSQPTTPRSQPTPPQRPAYDRNHGLLFAPGYNDKLLLRAGQLEVWKAYLRDNPRRLFVKRQHPELFRVRFDLTIGSQTYSALGNRFLLCHPLRIAVQCSRRMTETQIEQRVEQALEAARQGAVHVSPAISPGEKAVMRALLNAHCPIIFIEENGLTPYTKPGGELFEACNRGQLLILAPWEHHNERIVITRDKCLALNQMATEICK